MTNHTKILSLTIMLLFIKSNSNMRINPDFMWFCDYRSPILCDLRRNPNCFYHQLNHFASGIIMYTLKETFHRITSLLRPKIVINEFELKLKNLGNIQGTFKVHSRYIVETCYFKFLDFSLRIFSKYLFDYSRVFN